MLKPGGWLIFEIGWTQGPAVEQLLKNAGFEQTEIIKDWQGLDRVVCGRKPE
jgi:release factor glutamine methyltransferase